MNRIEKKLIAGILTACLILMPTATIWADKTTGSTGTSDEFRESQEMEVIELADIDDFLELVENCRNDTYSIGKRFELKTNLNLASVENFEGIAYFNGTFCGNGYTISSVNIARDGSEYGFFRYLGKSAVVTDLNVSGNITMTGSMEEIGGIAGVNYGTIRNCTFCGKISGENSVGAIAGVNKNSGMILECSNRAVVLAVNNAGGIAGYNEGIISDCSNEGNINMEELDMTLDIGGVDLGNFNLLQNVATKNNMGGIAGYSSGIISSCENNGTIGYPHTGYNVGGIAGSQNGKIMDCTNFGQVNGRKDVGGIVGQAEPYIEREYLEDRINETKDEIDQLSRTLSSISTTVSQTSSQVKEYTDSLEILSENISDLTALADITDPQIQEYVDDINQAWDDISSMEVGKEGITQEQRDQISDALSDINDNLTNLQNNNFSEVADDTTGSPAADSAEQLVGELSDRWTKDTDRGESIQEIVDMIDSGIQSVNESVQSARKQMDGIADGIESDLKVITGEEDYIKDISSMETAESTDGVILGCTNEGDVCGDLNVGGIAGNMNIEYDVDPEMDLDFSKSTNVTVRSTVSVAILHSINTGDVTAKKSAAGGIVGLQELGFLCDCEGYGAVEVESGSYLGGIVGKSDAAVQNCYSQCMLTGLEYVGGIAGAGNMVSDSIGICSIDAEGERIGGVIGWLQEEGTAENNFFVGDEYGGIDNINYAGSAERISYDEVMEMEGIPDGFSQVMVTFELEDEVLARTLIPYGESVPQEEFPEIPQKEDYYVVWENGDHCDNVTENLILQASYVPWMESVAAEEKSEDGRSLILAVGKFYDGTTLTLNETQEPEELKESSTLLYAYDWEIANEKDQSIETAELHLYVGEEQISRAKLMAEIDGTWEEIDTELDGSYLVAQVPYKAPVAVVMESDHMFLYCVLGAGTAIVIILIILLFRKKLSQKRMAGG